VKSPNAYYNQETPKTWNIIRLVRMTMDTPGMQQGTYHVLFPDIILEFAGE
jgi:hypothetical protein